jgi:hypothetical protein
MGQSNYELTPEQKKQLNIIADAFVCKIESELSNDIGGILDPYDTPDHKLDVNKITAMIWYIGDQISTY